jgi:transposase
MDLGQRRRVYTKEFKEETVHLVLTRGMSVSEVSKDLGIGTETIYRWIRQYKSDPKNSFPGKGHLKPEDEKLRKLERELADVKEERDILKKAISIFSKTK